MEPIVAFVNYVFGKGKRPGEQEEQLAGPFCQ
jgi:hypothetical protein